VTDHDQAGSVHPGADFVGGHGRTGAVIRRLQVASEATSLGGVEKRDLAAALEVTR
jgi:hypothetical protein